MAQGDQPQALAWFTACLELEPLDPEALTLAGALSLSLRRYSEAESYARKLKELQPNNHQACFLLACALRGLERHLEGLAEIDCALTLEPNDFESLVTKARLLSDCQLPGLSVEMYRKVLRVRPYPPAAIDLSVILLRDNHPDEALELLLHASPQVPETVRPYTLIAQAYTELHRFDKAEAHWRLAEKYSRDRSAVQLKRARSEIAAGRFQVAEDLLQEAIDIGTRATSCFAILTTARKISPNDLPLIERMAEILESGDLTGPEAAELSYALGKSYDDLGDYGRAIGFFDEANRLSYDLSPNRRGFSRDRARAFTDFQIECFSKERIQHLVRNGISASLPLFVVGMMRSGTTLTESIMGAHSKIKAGGEQSFWTAHAVRFMNLEEGTFDPLVARRLGGEYLDFIDPKKTEIEYVVDKNPGNISLASMLHCIFPNAKFVHVKRHPVDNLLSLWMTPVSGNVGYMSDRENLVFAYREYLRLLAHLNEVLPADSFATFRYEDITSTPEAAIAELFRHIGLEAEPDCFAPEKSSRSVLTPSVYQVRQPIHRASQDRWKRYEPWLGPFADLLDEAKSI